MKGNPLTGICYVLNYFPQPSETFIADEALSVRDCGARSFVLYLSDGDASVIHPSAGELIDSGVTRKTVFTNRVNALRSWGWILTRRPRSALIGMVRAIFAADRWRYFQALGDAEWCLKNDINYLHAHFADTNFIYAGVISTWTGIPYGVTTHRYDLFEDPVPLDRVSECLDRANLVVTISNYNRKFMAEKYGLLSDRVKVIHCGVDTERFHFTGCKKTAKTEDLPLSILNVGRLVAVKGQDILLKALALVRNRGIKFELSVIGGGPLLDELTQLAQRLGIVDCVRFLGVQPQNKVIAELEMADLFVLPSLSEGLPVACMETMAIGTPIIATRISGIPELIDDGVSGLLVDPGDAEQLANAICWVHANRSRLPGVVLAGRKKIEAEFDRKVCSSQLVGEISRTVAMKNEEAWASY